MRKFAVILLLVLFLFNWFGYRLFISFQQESANTKFENQLDQNSFDETQLVSVKIPAVYFSGYVNEKSFKRINGQVDINGILYNYVKVRVYNDSLEMLCVPNEPAMNLSTAKNDFFKLVNDLQHKGNKKNNIVPSKNISTEYFAVNGFTIIKNTFFTPSKWPRTFISGIIFQSTSVPEIPPESLS